MKTGWILLALILIAVSIAGCASYSPAPSPTTQASNTANVTIQGFSFQPSEVTVARGGTVTWTNQDPTQHTVKFADSESAPLGKGSTYQKKFDTAGTYDYRCGIHPSMTGKVIVQ